MEQKTENISLAHGSGGKLTHEIIKNLFLKIFDNPILKKLNDSAVVKINNQNIAITTDSYTIKPIFFPGGDIGKLAICGTLNDLAVMGALPLYISCSYIIEEGFKYEDLEKITHSIQTYADTYGVKVVAGDTKVVEKGKVDGMFINTTGIGFPIYQLPKEIEIGDKILINGTIGDHEIAILTAREDLGLTLNVESDCSAIWDLIQLLLKNTTKIKFMRDPTRGGLVTTLNELIEGKKIGISIEESSIPIKEEVMAVCSLLGFDPLYLANEGKVVIVIAPDESDRAIKIMREHPLGKDAKIIGEIVDEHIGKVCLKTKIGGKRILDLPVGYQLPRIC